MLRVVNADGMTETGSLIGDIVREGARRMPAAALEAEVNAYIAELADQRDEHGRRLVVRNGYHQPRKVTTAAGVIEVKAPRVNDKRLDEATGEQAVLLGDPATLVPQVTEDQRSAAPALSAWSGLCPAMWTPANYAMKFRLPDVIERCSNLTGLTWPRAECLRR